MSGFWSLLLPPTRDDGGRGTHCIPVLWPTHRLRPPQRFLTKCSAIYSADFW